MKKLTSEFTLAAIALPLIFSSLFSTCYAQGSLTPPGPPAPTMITLAQVEPRTPISYPNYYIGNPGSYYLTTNLTSSSGFPCITIASGNVTLDLNGFALLGQAGSSSGISITGSYVNITVKNGIISGWGGNGVDSYSAGGTPHDVVLERLIVNANGNDGISIGNAATVSDCTVSDNIGIGIYVDGSGSQVINSTVFNNNTGENASRAAIYIQGSNNRIEGNHVTTSTTGGYGIFVLNTGTDINNVIVKNSVEGLGANNYSVPAGNDLGPVGTATNSTSPWANISH